VSLAGDFADFLTLPAYERLLTAERADGVTLAPRG
jgi:hypothetical protein